MRKREKLTPEERFALALDLIKREHSFAEVCAHYQVSHTTAYKIRHGDRSVDRAVTTLVAVRALRAAELDAYLACGEWRGKAGGYAVQGIAGAFITELRGSHTNVIGLPVAELLADLQALEALPRYPRPAFGDTAGE